jgi:hypothetical protein
MGIIHITKVGILLPHVVDAKLESAKNCSIKKFIEKLKLN